MKKQLIVPDRIFDLIKRFKNYPNTMTGIIESDPKGFAELNDYFRFEVRDDDNFLRDNLLIYIVNKKNSKVDFIKEDSQEESVSKEQKDTVEEEKMTKTYYVSKEQLKELNFLREQRYPLNWMHRNPTDFNATGSNDNDLSSEEEKAALMYMAGSDEVEFKVYEEEEGEYVLARKDDASDTVYMRIDLFGNPVWTDNIEEAKSGSYDEMRDWVTPAWDIYKKCAIDLD